MIMTMTTTIVRDHGKPFDALRDDQKRHVQHLMQSWHAIGGFHLDRAAMKRAIKKAKNNLP